jgi:hypothetical protein
MAISPLWRFAIGKFIAKSAAVARGLVAAPDDGSSPFRPARRRWGLALALPYAIRHIAPSRAA